MRIGSSNIMLTEEQPDFGNRSAKTQGGTPVQLHMYVTDADSVFENAIAYKAKSLIPIGDQFYGARSGRIEDPFGLVWIIETQKEDWRSVPQPERQKRRG